MALTYGNSTWPWYRYLYTQVPTCRSCNSVCMIVSHVYRYRYRYHRYHVACSIKSEYIISQYLCTCTSVRSAEALIAHWKNCDHGKLKSGPIVRNSRRHIFPDRFFFAHYFSWRGTCSWCILPCSRWSWERHRRSPNPRMAAAFTPGRMVVDSRNFKTVPHSSRRSMVCRS